MRRETALLGMLAIVFAVGMGVSGMAVEEESDRPPTSPQKNQPIGDLDNVPGIVFDDSIGDWVVDRFAGNNKTGPLLYQGPARVSPEGRVLDEKPISIAAGPRTQTMPDVAADDKGFRVVWHGFQGEETISRVFAARVRADGAAAAPVTLTEGSSPRIAFSGKDHLVTCFDARRSGKRLQMYVKYLLLDADGEQMFRSTYRENFAYSYLRQISVCGVPGKGWVLVCPRNVPDFWSWRGPGAQRLFSITPEGQRAADSPAEKYYDPKREPRVVVPANWQDTSIGKETHRAAGPAAIAKIWPWGNSALALDGQVCVAVWQRYHTGGETGIDLVNGDIQAGRAADGWKPLDKDGVAVAASAASERNPALAGNGVGKLLCVYEKIADGTTHICARTIETP